MSDWTPIEDYYLIGDLHTAALVSKKASIDWLCFPHFDSPSIFGKILDQNAGSFHLIDQQYDISHRYYPDTAVVEFTCQNNDADFTLYDYFLPQEVVDCGNHFLIREIHNHGKPTTIKLVLDLKPNYAQDTAQMVYHQEKHQLELKLGNDTLLIHLPPQANLIKDSSNITEKVTISFTLTSNDHSSLVMEYIEEEYACQPEMTNQALETTKQFWHRWVAEGNYFEWCRDQLVRSAITLKLMQHYPTGAIVAAPTTSLPEGIGGVRNWDYRYVWIRDATFTLNALSALGYTDEAERFYDFIEQIVEESASDSFDLELMYDIYGDSVPAEKQLDHLSGYQNSKPVRVGNSASAQFQLDLYGTLIDTYYFATRQNIERRSVRKKLIINLVKKIIEFWQRPDSGIWEVRDAEKHFTYSKVMSWVGVTRALRMAKEIGMTEQEKKLCETTAKEIEDWIWQECFDQEKSILRQHPGTQHQDATNFLLVLLGFLDRNDPTTQEIIRNTRDELAHNEVFVHRYNTHDGLPGSEGAFVLCTFWLISAWALVGNKQRAQYLFDTFKTYINETDLIAEEIDHQTGAYLGNFPQAFSHIGYILSAYYLEGEQAAL